MMVARVATAPPGLLQNAPSHTLSSGNAALHRTAPPSYYQCDSEAQSLSMYIFNKLDVDSSGYLEAPHELHGALEVMLGMYCALGKPLAGPGATASSAVAKSSGQRQLSEMLSAILTEFDSPDGRMDFMEWDAFARSMYEAAGRQRYWSIASLWAERLAHEAPHANLHKGNLLRDAVPEKPWLNSPRTHLLPQSPLCNMDAEVPENLPHLPPVRGRFQLTNLKSGSPRETAVKFATAPTMSAHSSPRGAEDLGVDGSRPPFNGSPTPDCSPGRTLNELGLSPPRRRRRVLDRIERDVGGFVAESQPAARCISIPGKVARAVLPPATAPCQRSRVPRQRRQNRQAGEAGGLLRRDGGMMVAMNKLRKHERLMRKRMEAAKQMSIQFVENAVEIGITDTEAANQRLIAATRIQAWVRAIWARWHFRAFGSHVRRQTRRTLLFHMQELRDLADKQEAGSQDDKRKSIQEINRRVNIAYGHSLHNLQAQLNMVQNLAKSCIKKKKVRIAPIIEEKAITQLPAITVDELWDILTSLDGSMKTQIEVREMLDIFEHCKQTGLDLMLASRVPAEDLDLLDPNVAPEDISVGEVSHLCMMMIENSEHDLSESDVRGDLNMIKDLCRRSDYRSIAAPREQYLNLVLFRRLIRYISLLMQIDEAYIISHIYWLSAGHFEMTDTLAAIIMKNCARKRVHHGKGKGTAMDDFGYAEEMQARAPSPRFGNRPDDDWDEDMMLGLLDEKFNGSDFSRLCYACHAIDPREKVGIPFVKINSIFSNCVRNMDKLINARVQLRPQLKKSWKQMKQQASNADVNAQVAAQAQEQKGRNAIVLLSEDENEEEDEEVAPSLAKERRVAVSFDDDVKKMPSRRPPSSQRPRRPESRTRADPQRVVGGFSAEAILGRTEFSILMEATYKAMPHNIYSSPMQMCVEFLQTCEKKDTDMRVSGRTLRWGPAR